MTQLELIGELKKLTLEERLELIEQAVQLIRQDLKKEKEAPEVEKRPPLEFSAHPVGPISEAKPPLELNAWAWTNWPADATFSREEIYDDDGR